MTDIEEKALTLVNEVRAERSGYPQQYLSRRENQWFEALCRAIEQHEAFRQEVSDETIRRWPHGRAPDGFVHFIIAKPDRIEALEAESVLDAANAARRIETERAVADEIARVTSWLKAHGMRQIANSIERGDYK